MKIERQWNPPPLWSWMRNNLPPSLEAVAHAPDYGCIYAIHVRQKPTGIIQRLISPPEALAWIESDSILLYNTSYFSDFEALGRRYEAEVGKEITLKYWQSPKDQERPALNAPPRAP